MSEIRLNVITMLRSEERAEYISRLMSQFN